MPAQQLHDGNPDGCVIGQATSDLIGFYGTAGTDQAAGITLATNATAATVRTAVRSIITMLSEKGLIASGP